MSHMFFKSESGKGILIDVAKFKEVKAIEHIEEEYVQAYGNLLLKIAEYDAKPNKHTRKALSSACKDLKRTATKVIMILAALKFPE